MPGGLRSRKEPVGCMCLSRRCEKDREPCCCCLAVSCSSTSRHTQNFAGEFIDQRRSCRPVSLRETTMLRGYAGATGGFGPEVMKTYKVPLEESELFKSAQRRAAQGAGHMSGHFREIKLEDGAYHTREEDNIETEITMGEVGELGPSQKKVKLEDNAYIKSEEGGVAGGFEHPQKRFKREDGNYLGREEGGSVDTVMGEVGESGQSRKKIKLEDGTYIKREEGVETAYADDGRRRRNSRVPRRPGMTPRTKEAKFEDSPCVKRKEGF
ncbi:hypothetical protein BDZ45DRAFT_218511 [Acephala macrosclerotiorum]|nr:hypothetical protein BDZ45DRAFT_218511 [Acephala macrosclerotiorum]